MDDQLPGQMSIYDIVGPNANERTTSRERVLDYLRALRVETLAKLLSERYGYEPGEAYLLAFRSVLGLPPREELGER